MRGFFGLALAALGATTAHASLGYSYVDASDTTMFIQNNAGTWDSKALRVEAPNTWGVAISANGNWYGIQSYGMWGGLSAEGDWYGATAQAHNTNGTGLQAIGQYAGLNGQGGLYGLEAWGGDRGVWANATNNNAMAVRAEAIWGSGGVGVSALANHVGVRAEGSDTGVVAFGGSTGVGLYAIGYDVGILSKVTHAVQNTPAVSGISIQGHGVNGNGLIGSSGYASGTVNNIYGAYGNANGTGNYYNSYGVFGTAANGANNWSGYFTGDVYVGGTFVNPSDEKFKKNIQPLQGSLGKVLALRPKTYEMKVEEYQKKVMLPEGNRYGLIAQELEKVLPDLVHKVSAPAPLPDPTDRNARVPGPEENTDFKSVDYISLIPILIGAIQELQAEVETLKRAP